MPCIFCEIAAGRAPASLVYEDDDVYAMMSLEQPNAGKALVIPRAHVESLYDLDDATAAAVMRATVRVARAIRAATGCPGLNLVQSNGRAGQQHVWHLHMHLVPRFVGDGILLRWDNTIQPREALDRLAAEIRAKMA